MKAKVLPRLFAYLCEQSNDHACNRSVQYKAQGSIFNLIFDFIINRKSTSNH